MVVSFSSANLPHPSSSPCGADVSSILTNPKATHTQKHHLGPCFSCACVCVCVWAVWYVCTILPCAFLDVSVFVWFIYIYKCIFIHLCMCVCILPNVCVLLVIEGDRGSRWCYGQTVRCTCVWVRFLLIFFRSPLACLCVCMCVCCLFTYPPPGQEFPDELCLWQVGSFGKSDTHRTNVTRSLFAPFLLSHTSISPFIPWFLFRVLC